MKLRAYCPNICSELWVQSPPLLCNLLRPLCLFAAAAVHWPGTVPCPTGDRPKQPCDGRRRQLFQRPLFAYLTFSYFVRSIVLLAGFSTALQWWQYYALRGIHERDSDLQSNIGAPKSKVWVFLEGHKIKKKSLSYFWQKRLVLWTQQRTCQKFDEYFSKQMWSSIGIMLIKMRYTLIL